MMGPAVLEPPSGARNSGKAIVEIRKKLQLSLASLEYHYFHLFFY